MSTALQTAHSTGIPALAMSEEDLMRVLRNSLYPGAEDDSIKLVIQYCRASQLDPMQKPVHIVPIYDGKAKCMRDVVMPGIGLYRTQAARSGQYAGVTEPEFGDDVTETLDGTDVTYPKWCKVTVQRLIPNGAVVNFTAKELWKENYATQKRDTTAPNSMWKRRPYAQLAKCAEAQALRKAFPEFGAQPTADEMEGKEFGERDITPAAVDSLPPYSPEKFTENFQQWEKLINGGTKTADDIVAKIKTRNSLTIQQESSIRNLTNQGDVYEHA